MHTAVFRVIPYIYHNCVVNNKCCNRLISQITTLRDFTISSASSPDNFPSFSDKIGQLFFSKKYRDINNLRLYRTGISNESFLKSTSGWISEILILRGKTGRIRQASTRRRRVECVAQSRRCESWRGV